MQGAANQLVARGFAVFLYQLNSLVFGLFGYNGGNASGNLGQAEGRMLKRDLARFQLVHVQHFVDKLKQNLCGFLYLPAAFIALFQVVAAAFGDFQHAHDAVQRRADVVAHAQQEIGFRVVGALGLLLGGNKLALVGLFLFAQLALLRKVLFDDVVDELEPRNNIAVIVHLGNVELVVVHHAAIDAAVGAAVFRFLADQHLAKVFHA